jgi:hypothetical protein
VVDQPAENRTARKRLNSLPESAGNLDVSIENRTARKRLNSIPESARDLGVSIATLRRACALNRCKSVTIGSRRLMADEELDRIKREGIDLR